MGQECCNLSCRCPLLWVWVAAHGNQAVHDWVASLEAVPDLALARLWDAAAKPGQPLSHSTQLDILQSLVPGRSPGHASRELLLQKHRREGDAAIGQAPQERLQRHDAQGEHVSRRTDLRIAVKDVHGTELWGHVPPGAPAFVVKRQPAIWGWAHQ